MNTLHLRSRAKKYYYLLTFLFIVAQALFFTDEEVVLIEDVVGGFLLLGVICVFIGLTIKGHHWAKWILTLVLIEFGALFLFAGIEIPSLNFKILGISYFLFALIPHFAKSLRPISICYNEKWESSQIEKTSGYKIPDLSDRLLVVIIDWLVVIILLTLCIEINALMNGNVEWLLMVSVFVGLSYESVLIAYSSTIGQKVMSLMHVISTTLVKGLICSRHT